MSAKVNGGPPELPHLTFNMTPMNILLERTAMDAFKQLKENIQYLENIGSPDTESKRQFLDLLVKTRERFVMLYVLCKWSRNNEAIRKLIDIFAWLREQNQLMSNSILQFGELKGSLIAAKMLEPDLNTAMEVFSNGRPDLPTYNYLPREELDAEFVSKVIKNLNVELSIKMALQMNLPAQFLNYEIKDGRVNFDIPNHFKCSISMLKDEKFNLIDFKFGFQLINNKIVSDVQELDAKALVSLQNISNQKLVNNNLQQLFEFLFDYSATFKLQLIHKQLVNLKLSLWRGHLTHTYDSENKIIKVTYWLQRKFVKPSYIEIGLFDNNRLSFRWYKNSELTPVNDINLSDDEGVINLEKIINELIKRHIEIDIQMIKKSLTESISQLDRALTILPGNDKLQFKITQNREVFYGIDKLSGSPYFENPTPLMNKIGFKINSTDTLDYIELLYLKLEFQSNKMTHMMKAAGWMPIENVILTKEERQKLKIDYSDLKGPILKFGPDLTKITVFRRRDWQNGWFLLLGSFGWKSTIQLWCGRIECVQGIWKLNWFDEIHLNNSTMVKSLKDDISNINDNDNINNSNKLINLELLSFNDLIEIVKISSSRLISNLVVNEFEQQGCQLKVLNLSDKRVGDFLQFNFNIDLDSMDQSGNDSDNAVVLIKNNAWLKIQDTRDSLVLVINVKNSTLSATLYGQIEHFEELPIIEFSNDEAKLQYSPETHLFKVDCVVDLSTKLNSTSPGSVDGTNVNSNDLEDHKSNDLILSNVSTLLVKFSRLLNLLHMINQDSSLKITHAELDCVGFSYGSDKDEWVKLKLNQSDRGISVELPSSNPHKVCLNYLNALINNETNNIGDNGEGFNCMMIKQLVIYLKLTLKFYKSYQKLSNEQAQIMNKIVENDKQISNGGFILSLRGLENFRILYYKNTHLKDKEIRFEINVDMRHRLRKLSLNESLFMISVGDNRGANLSMGKRVKQSVDKLFKGEDHVPINGGRMLALRDSLCCDYRNISTALETVHSTICRVLEL